MGENKVAKNLVWFREWFTRLIISESRMDKIYFCLAINSDFLVLSEDPFFNSFFAIFWFISTGFKTDNEITLSSIA